MQASLYQGQPYASHRPERLSLPPSDRPLPPRPPYMSQEDPDEFSPTVRPSSQYIVPSPSAQVARFPDNIQPSPQRPNQDAPHPQYPPQSGQFPHGNSQYAAGGSRYPLENGQYPQGSGQYPQESGQYPQGSGQYPQGSGQYPQESGQYPQESGQYPQESRPYPQESRPHLQESGPPQFHPDGPRPQSNYLAMDGPQLRRPRQPQPTHFGMANEPPIVVDDPDPFYANNGYQSYPQQRSPAQRPNAIPPSPPPLLDHSHLRPGNQAALLSHEATLAHYRANAKKTNDPELIFEFAVFMIEASKSLHVPPADATNSNVLEIERATEKRDELIREALALLKRIADRGHVSAQYFLADCYANGIGTVRNRQDFDRAFPLFVLAAKHGHPDASYRAGTCLENGWGCRREAAKAVQFYRKAAAALHPGAMYRLGLADLNGDMGLAKSAKEGVKWLKRSAEHSTAEFPHALHELALLHERGVENVVFVDNEYAAELLGQAAELGYAPSAYRLGECYEYGRMGCPQDPALSIHYYNIAAQQEHPEACFALTAWYLVGSPGVLPQSDTEAFLWAKKAAEKGLSKAMYAVGYFYEVGIGTVQSASDAMVYYKRAADSGDKRAMQRLKATMHGAHPPVAEANLLRREALTDSGGKDKKDCIIM